LVSRMAAVGHSVTAAGTRRPRRRPTNALMGLGRVSVGLVCGLRAPPTGLSFDRRSTLGVLRSVSIPTQIRCQRDSQLMSVDRLIRLSARRSAVPGADRCCRPRRSRSPSLLSFDRRSTARGEEMSILVSGPAWRSCLPFGPTNDERSGSFARSRAGLPSASAECAGRRCHSTVVLQSCVAGHLRESGLVSRMRAIRQPDESAPGLAGRRALCGPAEMSGIEGCPEGRFGPGCWS